MYKYSLTSLAHQHIGIPEHLQPREQAARPELRVRRRQHRRAAIGGRCAGGGGRGTVCGCRQRLLLRRLLGGLRVGRRHVDWLAWGVDSVK